MYGGKSTIERSSDSLSIDNLKCMLPADQLQLKPNTIQLSVLIDKSNFLSLPALYTLISEPGPSKEIASSALSKETVSNENRVPMAA
jgi:hypothetical protein